MSDPQVPLSLLGGLTPTQFMRRHWQKKPLLVRSAVADAREIPVTRAALFELAQRSDVESRLIVQSTKGKWRLAQGPFSRRMLPPLLRPNWTLLVQGVDRHDEAAHRMVQRLFDFLPSVRFDDLMISYASEQGGVGPHVDRYDVFLLQAHGQRRWRIGSPHGADLAFVPDLPLKILSRFEPQQEYMLDPGDMLYLPPNWAHEGTAVGGDCITCSIGFRSSTEHGLATELLSRVADQAGETSAERRYRDPGQAAVVSPGAIPAALIEYAHKAMERALQGEGTIERVLGEWLSEPHPSVWFESLPFEPEPGALQAIVRLDRRSRMFYDDHRIYLNGESWAISGRDAQLLRCLADCRALGAEDLRRTGAVLRVRLLEWLSAGWLHAGAAPLEQE